MESRILLFLALVSLIHCAVVPSEIMYHPKQGSDYEFIEFHNTDTQNTAVISGWKLSQDVDFTFPTGALITPGGYIIVANKKEKFLKAYPDVPAGIVFGDLAKKLSDSAGTIVLADASGAQKSSVTYKDGWYAAADGYGSSLELACDSAVDLNSATSWRPSSLPTTTDPLAEFSGSPGAAGSWYSCPVTSEKFTTDPIYFTEIMYKPYKEKSRTDLHEYIEFYNAANNSVVLDNWRIVSASAKPTSLQYVFPAGTTIPANSYFVVAKSKSQLQSVYNLATSVYDLTFGDYLGELANGGDQIALVDTNGMVVDQVDYDNKFPWPAGADASVGPQYQGLSLQRVSFAYDSSKRYNWVAEVPSIGAQNAVLRDIPNPQVTELTVYQGDNITHMLVASTATSIKVRVSPKDIATALTMEYFVYDVASSGISTSTAVFTDLTEGYWSYSFSSGFPVNTIIKYRLKATYGGSEQVIYPRSNDPFEWSAFFISPTLDTTSDSYHLFITPSNWTQLWNNLRTDLYGGWGLYEDLPTTCCVINPLWNDRVGAVLGYKGQAYDVEVKYQGSPYNRARGIEIDSWPFPGPSAPSPLTALSWSIDLPAGVSIDGKETLYLLKPRDKGCSYITTYVMYELARQLGLPANDVKFSQLWINGGYYMYAMDVNFYSNNQVESYIEEVYSDKCATQGTEEVGIMYKAHGFGCEGPVGPANEEYLWPITSCGTTGQSYTTEERVAQTYDLETQSSWADWNALVNLTNVLNGPNKITFTEGGEAGRAWFNANFDVNHMLNYIVLVNWAGAWDDLNGNHMIYQRISDGKWTMVPWDMDSYFGRETPCKGVSTCSLYLGEQGAEVSSNQSPGGYNVLKDAFIKSFRQEVNARYVLLANTVLSIDNVNAVITKASQKFNVSEFLGAASVDWNDDTCIPGITQWHAARNAFVKSTLGSTTTETLQICPSKPDITIAHSAYQAAPGKPLPPRMSDTTSSSITLVWSSPNPNGSPVTSYVLERKSSSESTFTQIYSGSANTYADNGLSAMPYSYRVRATNAFGTSATGEAATFIPGSLVTTGVPIGTSSEDVESAASAFSIIFAIIFATLCTIF